MNQYLNFLSLLLLLLMGTKGKKHQDQGSDEECAPDCEEPCCGDEEDEVDIEEQVENKIKALPTLKEKVQAIAINGYLVEKRKLDKQLESQIEAIELKFRQTFKPYIEEVNSIVSGKHQITDADFQEIGELLTPQELETKHNYFNNQKIAEYWLKVLTNSDIIAEQIEERDEALLKHLQRVDVSKSPDLKRLSITFYFSENEWFTNEKLLKEFELQGDVIKKSFGDQINWKEGKNITIKIVKKKNKKKGGEKKTKEVKEKSFFNFFLDIEIQSEDEQQEEAEQNDDIEELELQYEMAQALYEEIVPRSLEYYLGVVENIEDYGGLDQIQEEEEEEQQPKKKNKSKGKKQ